MTKEREEGAATTGDVPWPDADAAALEADARGLWFRTRILPLEPHLRRFVRRILPNEADVDDIVHDTFIRLISMPRWQDIEAPGAFMKTVARNLVHDLFRHRSVIPIYYVADLEATNVIDELANPEVTVAGRDELRYLAQLVENLPSQCRKVFELRKVHGLAFGEIARQLGLSVSTVEKHMVKALRLCSEGLARREGVNMDWRTNVPRRQTGKRRTEY